MNQRQGHENKWHFRLNQRQTNEWRTNKIVKSIVCRFQGRYKPRLPKFLSEMRELLPLYYGLKQENISATNRDAQLVGNPVDPA